MNLSQQDECELALFEEYLITLKDGVTERDAYRFVYGVDPTGKT